MVKTLADAKAFFDNLPRSGKVDYDEKIRRAGMLFDLLGNPQNSFKSVHIAATSGKGSTATMIAALLQAAGKTVGLTVSPHLKDIRERFRVNGQFIGDEELCDHINTLIPHLEKVANSQFGAASFFEVVTALAFMVFRQHAVDYAAVEVGLGGQRDATNTISRPDKLAILGQIGLDHTKVLGETVAEIAAQKAGIIRPGIKVIALDQDPLVMAEFSRKAKQARADMEVLVPGKHAQHIRLSLDGTVFNLKLPPWSWRDLQLGVIGKHQAINAAMALRAVQFLGERDGFEITETAARQSLASLKIPGRFELRKAGSKFVILDGAHNPQKFESLKATLKTLFPKQKAVFLLAFKGDKDLAKALGVIAPLAESAIMTSFYTLSQDFIAEFADPEQVSKKLRQLGVEKSIAITDNGAALDRGLAEAKSVLVCTGSFYLLDALYDELEKRGIK